MTGQGLMEKITSLAKRRGFVFPGSEIYGGLAGTWDYGPLGALLKQNIKNSWICRFVQERDDMHLVDSAILMNSGVWKASGHVASFSDPMIDCKKCKSRFRADKIDVTAGCPDCKANDFTEARPFNMMFKTNAGPVEDSATEVYLRPETAQGMFVNFKNVLDSAHPELPFGLAQIGKAFRNEITPGNFLFRLREFEQMEIEYFIRPEEWETHFEYWRSEMVRWSGDIGLLIEEREISPEDRAFYSKRTIDFYFNYPFGADELYGLAYRTDYDLYNQMKGSGAELTYFDQRTKEKILPHVIEPTFGMDRTVLALLVSAFTEEPDKDDTRAVLKLKPAMAPYKAAVFPLLSNKPELVERARQIYGALKSTHMIAWDDIGNIGKRYRRQDEIGTPFCITVDFETLEDGTVTVRDRDSMQQERIASSDLQAFLKEKIA